MRQEDIFQKVEMGGICSLEDENAMKKWENWNRR